MKRRILFGWEFGAGNGHAVVLREIARHFPSETHDLQFAVRFPTTAIHAGLNPRQVIETPGKPLLGVGKPAFKQVPRATYGEFVCEALMGPGQDFPRRLAGWDNIVTGFRPDVIVAEYAPGLSLYARGRIPVVATGSGYSLPPVGMTSFPPIMAKPVPLFATEEELLGRLNLHLQAAGALTIERLPQLNAADAHGLMTLPLFDPYSNYRDTQYLGVGHPGGSPEPLEDASDFIAYFDETWQLEEALLNGLRDARISGHAYLGTPLRRTVKRLAGSSITLAGGLFNLSREMPGKAVAIHMGTLGFASAAALAGVPQIILFHNQENRLIGLALQNAGAALIMARRKITAAAIAEAVRLVASDTAMRAAARRLAEQLTPFRNRNPVRDVAEMVNQFIR